MLVGLLVSASGRADDSSLSLDASGPLSLRVVARDRELALAAPIIEGETAAQTFERLRLWPPGTTVTVAFRGGTSELHGKIASVADEWSSHGNLQFDSGFQAETGQYREWSTEDTAYAADIRIAFDQSGYWSYLGADGSDPVVTKPGDPTMSLAGFDRELPPDWRFIVLHQFGHALGLPNAHQSRDVLAELRFLDDTGYVPTTDPLGWLIPDDAGRSPGILSQVSRAPNFWTQATIDRNFEAIDPPVAEWPDPESVMLYTFQPTWFRDGNLSEWYRESSPDSLSEADREAMRRLYPSEPSPETVAIAMVRERYSGLVSVTHAAPCADGPGPEWTKLPERDVSPADILLEASIGDERLVSASYVILTISKGRAVGRIVAAKDVELPIFGEKVIGEHVGTAFLIGDDVILTNFHVVPGNEFAKSLRAEFNCVDGSSPPDAYQLEELLAFSNVPQLDFAIVRVQVPAGQTPPGKKFGAISLTPTVNQSPLRERPLTIIQHPEPNGYQKFSFGGDLTHQSQDGRFLLYTSSTSGGSSGSPVFDKSWTLLALHQGVGDQLEVEITKADGTKSIEKRPRNNRGVSVERIIRFVRDEAQVDQALLKRIGIE